MHAAADRGDVRIVSHRIASYRIVSTPAEQVELVVVDQPEVGVSGRSEIVDVPNILVAYAVAAEAPVGGQVPDGVALRASVAKTGRETGLGGSTAAAVA